MKGLVILLAEDNPADVYLVRRALKQHAVEHELIVAPDGEEAIRKIEEGRALGLVLLDLNLPKMSGQEILQHLRGRQEGQRVPVIVITSSDSGAERARMSELGAQAYFRKPSQLEEFMTLGALVKQVMSTA